MKFFHICATALMGIAFASCSSDTPTVSLGLEDHYTVPRMKTLRLSPALTGESYSWQMQRPDGAWVTLASTRELIFVETEAGLYNLRFRIVDGSNPMTFDFSVNVVHEEIEYSPYITKVYEYCPAPGQFVNMIPLYEDGDTYADILRKTEESISGTNDGLITLGGFGGYVTFGFDHTVVNVEGENDFRLWGNAFYEAGAQTSRGGSAEPGIVMVSLDVNGNGIPDDPWYELKGSETGNPATTAGYSITYYRTPEGHVPEKEGNSIIDARHIRWTDSQGNEGYMEQNTFHQQPYYPRWTTDASITFTGTRLPGNAVDVSGQGTQFLLTPFAWGYADSHPNTEADLNSFDITNAIDADGNPVRLPGADFIRVYTGVRQSCGWIGETSTELSRAQDLHLPAKK